MAVRTGCVAICIADDRLPSTCLTQTHNHPIPPTHTTTPTQRGAPRTSSHVVHASAPAVGLGRGPGHPQRGPSVRTLCCLLPSGTTSPRLKSDIAPINQLFNHTNLPHQLVSTGEQGGGDPLRPRRERVLHADGRDPVQNLGGRAQLRRHLPGGRQRGTRARVCVHVCMYRWTSPSVSGRGNGHAERLNRCCRKRTKQVPDFNVMYELYDECTMMFFFRNKHIMVDLGTGNNNKVRRRCTNSTNAGAESCLRLCMAALFQYRQLLTRPCSRLPPPHPNKTDQLPHT